MKTIRNIICAFFLLGGLTLQAAPVSQSRALEVAKAVLAAQPATKAAGDVKLIWNGEDIATKSAVQPAFYVFGRDGGGFVIVAGDDNVRPVLALSQESDFAVEDMPSNVKWWMEQLKGFVRAQKVQTPEARELWSQFTATKSLVITEVTDEFMDSRTVPWNQSGPAARKTPVVEGQGESSVCGCLPLAMAEILVWFGSPVAGTGSLPDYSYTAINKVTVNMTGYDLGVEYDWAQLRTLDTYAKFKACETENVALADNLGQLVYDCGFMLQSHYNAGKYGGTGATSTDIVRQFADHMGYSKAAYREFGGTHALPEMEALLVAQITSHPLLCCGYAPGNNGNDAGHAYVFDGFANYSGHKVFHVNFGWGGTCNGYYFADAQNPVYLDPKTHEELLNYNFREGLEFLFDFVPATGETQYVDRLIVDWSNDKIGLTTEETTIRKDVPFNVDCQYIRNVGAANYNGIVRLSLEDKEGVVKQEYASAEWVISNLPPDGFAPKSFSVTLTEDLQFGDKIVPYYLTGSQWKRVPGTMTGYVVFELPVMPAAFIATESSYQRGDYFPFHLKNQDRLYVGTVWTITAPDGTVTPIPQSTVGFTFTQSGQYKIEAAVAPSVGADVVETLVTYVTVH